MSVLNIGVLALAALVINRIKKGRALALLGGSVFFIYWLQPVQQITSLTYWLPTATLALTIFCWIITAAPEVRSLRRNLSALFVIAAVVIFVDLNQFIRLEQIFMIATPRVWIVFLVLSLLAISFFVLEKLPHSRWMPGIAILGIIFLFIFLKTPFVVNKTFETAFPGRAQPEAGYVLSWLGFSYIAFRLLHTLRDYQSNRLPVLDLKEYVTYVLFFPSVAAGPIDRVDRFISGLRNPVSLAGQDWVEAGTRLFVGLFKKFVIADLLAVVSVTDALIAQVRSPGWMWFFLFVYSLRIYFDFSGYTDVAIGLGRIVGVRLPENFASPYFKPNLTQFWNSWHMTLTQWFRAYFFNPLARKLRAGKLPVPFIIFISQISTMILIGLWHGVTWNYLLWGSWHGVGLFVQNRWSEWMQSRIQTPHPPRRQLILNVIGSLLTFGFVSIGWLFFTLSTPSLAWRAIKLLFGVGL